MYANDVAIHHEGGISPLGLAISPTAAASAYPSTLRTPPLMPWTAQIAEQPRVARRYSLISVNQSSTAAVSRRKV